MSGQLRGLSVLLAIAWPTGYALAIAPAPASLPAPALAVVAYAEQPVRVVRGTKLYRAGRGAALQDEDMLDTGDGPIQLDAGGATLALGPATRIYLKAGEFVLLEGWLKFQGRPQRPLNLAGANLLLSVDGAAATLHAAGTTSEVFAESGELAVREPGAGKARRAARVGAEQFASRSGAQALRVLPRPPVAFLAAMPRELRDALVPLAARAGTAAPRLERAATYAELAPWLAAHKNLRERLHLRFYPPRSSISSSSSSSSSSSAGPTSPTPDRQ